uniref:Uncharacterized protein n=1 Tax=Knipowitschia caucasica TaxID=637954 RepID=A0AAV2MLV3_KNICA
MRSFWGERVSGHVCTSALPVHCYILGIMEPLSPGADLGPDLSSLCRSEETSARRKLDKSGSQTRPGPSCESLKSDRSKDAIINFKRGKLDKSRSKTRPGPSCESLKSDWSKDAIINFKRRKLDKSGSQTRPGPSCESLKSDLSKDAIINFKRSFWGERVSGHVCTSALPVHCYILGIMEPLSPGADLGPDLSSLCLSEETSARRKVEKSGSQTRPGPSCESLKSDRSKPLSIDFKRDSNPHPALSCGSSLSDSSKDWLEEFKNSPPENMG